VGESDIIQVGTSEITFVKLDIFKRYRFLGLKSKFLDIFFLGGEGWVLEM
jgi:hypothetical protein